MRLILVEGPSEPVVSLEEMKRHLKAADFSDDDDAIAEYRDAAEKVAADYIGRALVAQTWDMYLEEFDTSIEIPLSPLIEIDSVKYYDADNVLQESALSLYEVIGATGRARAKIVLNNNQSWPTVYDRAEPVVIRFRAGYVDLTQSPAGEIPKPIIQAIKLITGSFYRDREDGVIGQSVAQIPWTAERLLNDYRDYSH